MAAALRIALGIILFTITPSLRAEPGYDDNASENYPTSPSNPKREEQPSTAKRHKKEKTKYFIEDPERIDAGTLHLGFAAGGNFYIQPAINSTTKQPTGDYFKDFGFQAGGYLDYDYNDIALGLRTFLGYKYILNSVHVFDLTGMTRYLIPVSRYTRLSVNAGVSAGLWYQVYNPSVSSNQEVIVFLPSLVLGASFDLIPFMVDFKWCINRFGADTTILGFELYFGVKI